MPPTSTYYATGRHNHDILITGGGAQPAEPFPDISIKFQKVSRECNFPSAITLQIFRVKPGNQRKGRESEGGRGGIGEIIRSY